MKVSRASRNDRPNPALKFAPSGRWDAPSARPLATRYAASLAMPGQKKSIMRLLISIILALLSTHAFSSSWNCRNKDMEIRCSSSKCEASDGFTPFDIGIHANGSLAICAYSGCWEGNGKVMKSGKYILISGTNLKWTGTNSGNADFIVAVDTSDKVGFVKGEGFAMPTICTMLNK